MAPRQASAEQAPTVKDSPANGTFATITELMSGS